MNCYEKMIPSPKYLYESGGLFSHKATVSGDFPHAIEVFKAYAKKAVGLDFTEGNDFTVCLDESLDEGEYAVFSTEGAVEITAGGSEGASYALASLLQIIENKDGNAVAPALEIRDKADNGYRGLMIDCARKHHPLSLLKYYVDLCWFYKIKYIHLHFTDDQAYTLPSRLFPRLTSRHNHYTENEISELVAYAADRDVQIVPEIDTPGHSKAIIAAYPEFCHTENKEIICFHPENIEKMQALYRELCQMFPNSEYIHIGADESAIMDWNECEDCIEFGRSLGIRIEEFNPYLHQPWHRAERFLVHYINKMAEAIMEEGRKPLVWEGFGREVNEYVTRDVTVMAFENFYQTPTSYIKNGFNIINCSWRPTYVVVPEYGWDKDECYKWDVRTFSAIHPDSPYFGGYFTLDSHKNIKGGQLNAWGDFLGKHENGIEMERNALTDKLPAIAESTWNHKKSGDYAGFLRCHRNCTQLFDRMISDDK